MENIVARLITIVALAMGIFVGGIVGHYEGQASVYARMVGQTNEMLSPLPVGKTR